MRTFVLLVGIVTSTVVASLLPSKALAATTVGGPGGTNITTSPVSSDLRVTPGQSVSTTISVQNNASSPVTVQLQLQTFKPFGTNGQGRIVAPTPHSAYISWVHFSQSSFVAQPGVWHQVQMTIDTPPTAALDYYYAVLVKPVIPTISALNTTSTIKGYNAVLILLDAVSPNAKPSITVTSFSANHGISEYLPVSFSINAKNTGNIFLPPTGDIYISKSKNFSSTINVLPVNTAQGNVIPGSSRIFKEQWTNGFPLFVPKTVDGVPVVDKHGKPIETLTWNFSQTNKFRFGEYYAKMVLVYSNGVRDVPISAEVSFWVIPWKIITAVAVVVVLSSVGLYVSGHKLADRTFKLSKKVRKQ
jgi:hypothetical protein